MSKLLFLILLLIPNLARAANDGFSSQRPAMWRSSRTATHDNTVLLATGPIHFHGIIIGSATVNIASSKISLYNSTSTRTSLMSVATAAFLNLGDRMYDNPTSSGTATVLAPRGLIEYDLYFSSGFVYDKQGASDITILWDFFQPKQTYDLVPYRP